MQTIATRLKAIKAAVADVPTSERSLCPSCTFVKNVKGRHQQTYLLCRNETIESRVGEYRLAGILGVGARPRRPHQRRRARRRPASSDLFSSQDRLPLHPNR